MLVVTFRTLKVHKTGMYADEMENHRKYKSPQQLSAEFIKNLQHNRSADTNRIVNSFKR